MDSAIPGDPGSPRRGVHEFEDDDNEHIIREQLLSGTRSRRLSNGGTGELRSASGTEGDRCQREVPNYSQRLRSLSNSRRRDLIHVSGGELERRPTRESFLDTLNPPDGELERRLEDCHDNGGPTGELERRSDPVNRKRRFNHDGRNGEFEQRASVTAKFPRYVLESSDSRRSAIGSDQRRRPSEERDQNEEHPSQHNRWQYQREPEPSRYGNNSNSHLDLFNQFMDAMKCFASSSSHNISSVNNVVPEFDPMSKNQTITSWISKVEESADIYDWNERQLIHYALPKLSGMAKSWYQSLPSLRFTWTEWKSKLLDAFPCRDNYAELLTEMLALRVKYGEPLEQYYYSKLNLLNRCQITGKRAVDCILYGIDDRAIKLGAQAVQFDSPEQVLKYLKTVKIGQPRDSAIIRTRVNRTDRRSDTTDKQISSFRKGPIKCFNCGIEGHPSFKCPKPLEKCNSCHRLGHRTETCPGIFSRRLQEPPRDNNSSNGKQVLKINVDTGKDIDVKLTEDTKTINEAEPNNKYNISIKVNDVLTSCFVDLGSDCCFIRYTDAKSMGLIMTYDNLPLVKGFGENLMQPVGKTNARVEVQGIEERVDMYVVKDMLLKQSVLLGHTFTELPGIVITKTPTCLVFERVAQNSKIFLMSSEDIHISPVEIKAVPVFNPENHYSGQVYINGTVRGKEGMEYLLLPGEYVLHEGCGNLLVQNLSDSVLKFSKGSLITRAVSDIKNLLKIETDSNFYVDSKKINHGETLTSVQLTELVKTITEFKDCFSYSLKDLGLTTVAEMEIKLKDCEPIVYRPYRLSHNEKALVRDMVQEMLDSNIVQESSSPYASPIVLVQKKSGEKRLCVDYRALNRKTVKDHYPLPRIEDQLDLLAGHEYFITLDLASGYYQIPIAEESISKTAFVTPDGQFEYLRMPFGLVNAPSVFQRTMNKILADAKVKYAIVYMDDILIPAHNFQEGLERLTEVLDLLRKGGLTLKLSKCHFFYQTIDFLGFEVSSQGVRPGNKKIESVANFPSPKNQHEVRQFMGLASFFRRFIKNFAVIARPLTDLLRKNNSWKWSNEQQSAFEELKTALVNRPVIALYDPSAETQLHTDASKLGIAGVLLQKGPEGLLRPVAFYSRKTTIDEQKLHSFELETLAVIASLSRFRVYLVGIPFKIFTDCNALRTTMTKRDLVPRIARWWIQLQEYDCEIVYRPGNKMSHVDALSRHPTDPAITESHVLDVLNIESDNWLSTAQTVDDEIKKLKDILENPDLKKIIDTHTNYTLKDGRVYRIVEGESRWVVPKAMRWQILKRNHDDIGHFSFDKTLSRIKSTYWFPKMRRFIKKYVSACLECAHHKAAGGRREGELHPIPKPERPFHTLHADHLGPFVRSKCGNCYLMVMVDAFSKFVNITAVRNTKSSTAIRVLKKHISFFGTPSRLITDRGSCFTSQLFKKFIHNSGITHVLNAVSTPRANGQVERFNKTILDALATKTHGKDDRTWDENIYDIQIGINTTVHKTTQKCPSELVFGFRLTNTSEAILNDVIDDTLDITPIDRLEEIRTEASERIRVQQEKDKERFDKNRKTGTKYKEGDLVRVERDLSGCDGKSKKLNAKFQGPYRIIKILPNERFVIEDTPITRKQSRRYESIVAIDKLRPWLNLTTDMIGSSGDEEESE